MSEAAKRPWKLDVRVGCVAVYNGPDRNCLASPPEAFIHYKHGVKDEDDNWCVREIDEANAAHIVRCVNMHDRLVEALEEIKKGDGAFSRDPLEHAGNCIENMKSIAEAALAEPVEVAG